MAAGECTRDSSSSLALVALSRIARARDEPILQSAAQTPVGATLLSLKAAVLSVAVSVGRADPSLSTQSTSSLFNLSGSGMATHWLRGPFQFMMKFARPEK